MSKGKIVYQFEEAPTLEALKQKTITLVIAGWITNGKPRIIELRFPNREPAFVFSQSFLRYCSPRTETFGPDLISRGYLECWPPGNPLMPHDDKLKA